MPEPCYPGHGQPQSRLVADRRPDPHRGAAHPPVPDRGLGRDPYRVRRLPPRYALPGTAACLLPRWRMIHLKWRTEADPALASIIHADWSPAGVACRGALWILILGSGCDNGPGGGPGAGGSTGPLFAPSVVAGTAWFWSGGLRQGGDHGPGGGDGIRPGPGRGDSQAAPAAASGQPGGGVQDLVPQRFRLGAGQVAVQGEQPQPGQQGGGDQGGGQPRRVDRERL